MSNFITHYHDNSFQSGRSYQPAGIFLRIHSEEANSIARKMIISPASLAKPCFCVLNADHTLTPCAQFSRGSGRHPSTRAQPFREVVFDLLLQIQRLNGAHRFLNVVSRAAKCRHTVFPDRIRCVRVAIRGQANAAGSQRPPAKPEA